MNTVPSATGFSTCDLCDAHEAHLGTWLRVLPPVFSCFGGATPFGGRVVTVRCHEDNSRVRELVNTAGERRVLVVDGGGSTRRALVGGNLAVAAARNGWAGIVVDGAVRDTAELTASGFPIRALALCPVRTEKRGEGAVDVPVTIQGVPVFAGDWLYADDDGIVIADRPLT